MFRHLNLCENYHFWHQQSTKIVKCKRFPLNETKIPISHNFYISIVFSRKLRYFQQISYLKKFSPKLVLITPPERKKKELNCNVMLPQLSKPQKYGAKVMRQDYFFYNFLSSFMTDWSRKEKKWWMYMFVVKNKIFVTIYSTFKQGSSANENLRWLSWFGKKLVWRIFD